MDEEIFNNNFHAESRPKEFKDHSIITELKRFDKHFGQNVQPSVSYSIIFIRQSYHTSMALTATTYYMDKNVHCSSFKEKENCTDKAMPFSDIYGLCHYLSNNSKIFIRFSVIFVGW